MQNTAYFPYNSSLVLPSFNLYTTLIAIYHNSLNNMQLLPHPWWDYSIFSVMEIWKHRSSFPCVYPSLHRNRSLSFKSIHCSFLLQAHFLKLISYINSDCHLFFLHSKLQSSITHGLKQMGDFCLSSTIFLVRFRRRRCLIALLPFAAFSVSNHRPPVSMGIFGVECPKHKSQHAN